MNRTYELWGKLKSYYSKNITMKFPLLLCKRSHICPISYKSRTISRNLHFLVLFINRSKSRIVQFEFMLFKESLYIFITFYIHMLKMLCLNNYFNLHISIVFFPAAFSIRYMTQKLIFFLSISKRQIFPIILSFK